MPSRNDRSVRVLLWFSMKNMNTVSILGCGWLGYPLALKLLAKGFKVKGSTTSQAKIEYFKSSGIIPYQLTVTNDEKQGVPDKKDFFEADLLIITLPPKVRKSGPEHGIGQIEKIKEATPDFEGKVIYTSSTSVYPNDGKSHDEKSVEGFNKSQSPLLDIERMLKDAFGDKLTLLRLGGLFGYDRIPVKYFLGKTAIDNGSFPVNYLHRDDAVNSIMTIIDKRAWDKIYNVVAPLHPTRKELFIKNAENLKVQPPGFSNRTTANFKIIDGTRMMRELDFSYQFPNPLDFSYAPVTHPHK